jgi:hypothetical protein
MMATDPGEGPMTQEEWEEHCRLFAEICNVIERNYQEWPLDGSNDGGIGHTSQEARDAAQRIFDILGIKQPTAEDAKRFHPNFPWKIEEDD